MFANEQDKKIKIPVQVINGQVKYFYGGNLPLIIDGAIGELSLPEYSIEDNSFLEVMQRQESIELLPSRSNIMVAVSPHNIPVTKQPFIEPINAVTCEQSAYVLVCLDESLKLHFRGSKKPKLEETKCRVVSLNIRCISLNDAYTVISREFEPQRKSHTGNVFKKCYYQEHGHWFPLERLRDDAERVFEDAFFLESKRFVIHPDFNDSGGNLILNEGEVQLVNALHGGPLNSKDIKALFNNDGRRHLDVVNRLLVRNVITEDNV